MKAHSFIVALMPAEQALRFFIVYVTPYQLAYVFFMLRHLIQQDLSIRNSIRK